MSDLAKIQEVYGPPVSSEIVDAGWTFMGIYLDVLSYSLPLFMLIATYICLRHLIYESLRFNYRHYLKYGEFVLLWGERDDPDRTTHRKEIAKEMKVTEDDFLPWFSSLAMSVIVFLFLLAVVFLWPITFIIIVPLLIVRGFAYRKRQKISFTQKLKGEHL